MTAARTGQFAFCNHCGHQNRKENKFCSKCGQRIQIYSINGKATQETADCPNCGQPNSVESRFCSGCSEPLVEDFKVADEGDFVKVSINLSQIDFENHRDLNTLSKRLRSQRILLDMTRVKWIDSTGIGALVTLTNRFARTQQEMKFYGMTPKVLDAFRALQVDNILELYETENEALVSWGMPPRRES